VHAFVDGEVPRFVLRSVRNGWRGRWESEGYMEEDFEVRAGLVRPANMSSEDMDIGWVVLVEITSERT
jgi:hypothetical protein